MLVLSPSPLTGEGRVMVVGGLVKGLHYSLKVSFSFSTSYLLLGGLQPFGCSDSPLRDLSQKTSLSPAMGDHLNDEKDKEQPFSTQESLCQRPPPPPSK